jgi:serine protease Do
MKRQMICAVMIAFATAADAAPVQKLPPKAIPHQIVPQSMMQVQQSFAPVVRKVAPAVVNVYARSVVQAQVNPLFNDPVFQRFFGVSPEFQKRVQQSLGSGVIVRGDGIILTNNHVIEGGQNIVVALADKREYTAKVLLADSHTDLAVLKIDTKGEQLPTIPFGDSDRLNVGDLVLAIGDPFGVGQTVTMGIVSALARTQVSASDYQFFIQTDAAINPGNSGGALVTTDGHLAGINTAIFSRSGESIGIGFAIPANLARRVVEGALGGGIKLAWIGADGQPVTAEMAPALGLSRPGGVVLKSVYPNGPVANAGLRAGDVILSVDGTEVDDMQGLNYRVATHKAGDVVKLHVSSGGKQRDVEATLAVPSENPPRQLTTVSGRNPMTGAKVENLSPAAAMDLQVSFTARGVAVVEVAAGSIAANYGFQPGDIIREINGTAVGSVNELIHALGSAQQWSMVVERGGRRLNLNVGG